MDNDCSGGAPECGLLGEYSYVDARASLVGSNESFGTDLVFVDVDGDGVEELVVGAPTWGGGGAVYLFSGWEAGVTNRTEADWAYQPSEGTGLLVGGALVAADVNEDGYGDLFVGNTEFPPTSSLHNPYVRLFLGSQDGLEVSPSLTVESPTGRGLFGRALAASGVNMAISWADYSDATDGRLYLWENIPDGQVSAIDADAVVVGAAFPYGHAITFGDWDGDGVIDLSVRGYSDFHFSYENSWTDVNSLDAFETRIDAASPEGDLGTEGTAADLNTDGYEDFVVGGPVGPEGHEELGGVRIFLGGPNAFHAYDASDAEIFLSGHPGTGFLAIEVVDLDGDGEMDVIAGDHLIEPLVEVYYGPFTAGNSASPDATFTMRSEYCGTGLAVTQREEGEPWLAVGCASAEEVLLFQAPGL